MMAVVERALRVRAEAGEVSRQGRAVGMTNTNTALRGQPGEGYLNTRP